MSTTYTPAEVFTPGEYLRDELEERAWTVTEFSEIIGRPIQAVSEILNGKKEITAETAIAFGDALGTSAELWLNLQTTFRLHVQRSAETRAGLSDVERRARIRELIPLAEVRKRGWVSNTSNLDDLESEVCGLLDVPTIEQRPSFAMAARRSNASEELTPQQVAWLAQVRRIAGTLPVSERFDPSALAEVASRLPTDAEAGAVALTNARGALATCGVRLVFLEGLRGGKLDGAVTFLPDGLPAIGLTTRGDRLDGVLFTLLHECAHLTLGHITPSDEGIILDVDLMADQEEPIENEANDQASDWLFPGGFVADGNTVPLILSTAARYRVHPSVVIGRLQRESKDWSRHRARIPKVRAELEAAGLMS